MEELRTDVVGWVVVLALGKELHRAGAQVLHFTESSLLWGYCPPPIIHFSPPSERSTEVLSPVTTGQVQLSTLSTSCVQPCFRSKNKDDTFSPWEVASLTANIISENYRKFHVRLMQGDRTSEKQTKMKTKTKKKNPKYPKRKVTGSWSPFHWCWPSHCWLICCWDIKILFLWFCEAADLYFYEEETEAWMDVQRSSSVLPGYRWQN